VRGEQPGHHDARMDHQHLRWDHGEDQRRACLDAAQRPQSRGQPIAPNWSIT
jgi:hypothetical protein